MATSIDVFGFTSVHQDKLAAEGRLGGEGHDGDASEARP